jgi:predicted Zn-dependent protease
VRLKLAHLFLEQGDFQQAVKVLNGLHKDFPHFEHLSEVFETMSKALAQMPGKQVQAEKAMALARHYA